MDSEEGRGGIRIIRTLVCSGCTMCCVADPVTGKPKQNLHYLSCEDITEGSGQRLAMTNEGQHSHAEFLFNAYWGTLDWHQHVSRIVASEIWHASADHLK